MEITRLLLHLKLSTETISLLMPATLLESIKIEANKRAVPYQSLIKMTLADQARISPPAPQRKLFDADKHRRRMKETWGDRVFSAEEVREMREAALGDRS